MTKTIILIHGAWLNSRSWEHWKSRYEAQGHRVIAPDWPYDEGEPADLRAHPRKALATSGPKDIVAHFERLIRALPEPPILIGHSAGGVWVQHLLDRGVGTAGVAIDPAVTPGVIPGWHATISSLPILWNPFNSRKVLSMTRKFFRKRFANAMPANLLGAAYDRYIVPTAAKIYWDGILVGGGGPITWNSRTRAPLLVVAGGKDLIADASMAKAIYKKQKRAASVTEFKLYAERSHTTCAEPGWEEVADFALDWALRNARGEIAPLAGARAA